MRLFGPHEHTCDSHDVLLQQQVIVSLYAACVIGVAFLVHCLWGGLLYNTG